MGLEKKILVVETPKDGQCPLVNYLQEAGQPEFRSASIAQADIRLAYERLSRDEHERFHLLVLDVESSGNPLEQGSRQAEYKIFLQHIQQRRIPILIVTDLPTTF